MGKSKNGNVKKSTKEEVSINNKYGLFNSQSLGAKFFASLLIFLTCLCISVASLVMTIRFEDEKTIGYTEKGIINYELCYKDDEFYQGKCFNSSNNMRFIANLIDNIKIKYNYNFDIDENESINYQYNIVAKLSINDSLTGKVFYEKEYPLVDNKLVKMDNDKHISIDENVDIVYGEYNNLANQFNSLYGVNSVSKLTVYMTVHKESDSDNISMNNTSLAYMSIPLSEKAVDVDVNTKGFENRSSVIVKSTIKIKNVVFGIIFLVFTFLTVIFVIKIVRILTKMFPAKSIFDKHIDRLLKEYDRLIGETKNVVSFEGKSVINFEKFSELLDIHDNLHLPIMYYNVVLHKEAYFYIVNDNIVYLYDAKESDFEKEK